MSLIHGQDPINYIESRFTYKLTKDQKQVCDNVQSQMITTAYGGFNVGKSYLSTLLAFWFAESVGGCVLVITPTVRQSEIIWNEIKKQNSVLQIGKHQLEPYQSLQVSEKVWIESGLNENSQALQAERLLVIIDEPGNVDANTLSQAKALLTRRDHRLLLIGRPFKCNHPPSKIQVWNHPNISWAYEQDHDGIHRLKAEIKSLITDPDSGKILQQGQWTDSHLIPKNLIPNAISVDWIENIARPHGESSDFWLANVEASLSH